MRNGARATPSGLELGDGRLSITKQSLDRRLDALCGQGISDEQIFVDKKTWATTDHEGGQKMLRAVDDEP